MLVVHIYVLVLVDILVCARTRTTPLEPGLQLLLRLLRAACFLRPMPMETRSHFFSLKLITFTEQ